MWHGLRTTALVMAMGVYFPAAAQSTNLSTYALFASDGLRARSVHVPSGDVGVNDGPLWVREAFDGPESTIVAELARVGRKSLCTGILADAVTDPVNGCAKIAPFSGPLVPDVAAACGFPTEAPACDPSKDVVVDHDRTLTLPPGVYGDLVVKGGGGGTGRVELAGGDYVFCSIRAGRRAELTFDAASSVFVHGDVRLENGTTTGPANGLSAADVQLFVAGDSVRVSRRADVTARLCAPEARLALSAGSKLTGSFVAKLIQADRVTATNEGGTTPSSTTSTTAPSTSTTTSSSTTTTSSTIVTTTSSSPPTTSTTSTSTTTTTTQASTTTTTTTGPLCDAETGLRATVSLSYDASSTNVNSALVVLTYPGGLGIPGHNQDASVQARIIPIAPDIITLGNDKDTDVNGIDETLTVGLVSLADEPTSLGDGIQPGQVFDVQFDCDGGPLPDASAVGCFVEGPVDVVSNPVPNVTCSVVLGPGVPVTTTTVPTTTTAPSTTTTVPSTTSTTVTTSSSTTTSSTSTTTTTLGGPAVCGNGVKEGTEECDDMNDDNNDACVTGCKNATCGDGFFWSGVEQCDDHNNVNGDGCSASCITEPPVCGNDRIETGETCDDGNTVDGDACPANCRVEFCSPSALTLGTTVSFTKPAGVNVGSIVVFVNYPDGKVGLPGTGNGSTVRARITGLPTGFVHTANDLDYAIREVISPQLPGNVLGGTQLLKASFDRCSGAVAPAAGEFTCTVEQVGAPNGSSISPAGFACAVTIP